MIRYLRTFLVAAQTNSFSHTGALLGLTQAAVSLQIRRLEEDLGCQLFDRTGKSVSLSAEGRRILADAARIVELYAGLKGQSQAETAVAAIDLGAISTVQSTLLPKALHRFRTEFPGVHVNIVPGMSAQLLTQVDAGELDLAVMIKPRLGIPAEMKWLPLMRERYIAIAPAGVPQDLRKLVASQPFIRYNRRSHGGQLVDAFLKRHNLWVNEGMELDEPAIILEMVSEGLGWAVIPGELVQVENAPGVTPLALPGRPFFREIGVLARLSALESAAGAAFIRWLQEETANYRRARSGAV